MQTFRSASESKEYLIGRILTQAEQDGVTLSEIERKMLHSSETASTLPDMMEISAQFDRDCDQDEYEEKIAEVVRHLKQRQEEAAARDWGDALNSVRREGHYLLVLIDAAAQPPPSSARLPGDRRRLILTAAFVCVVITGIAIIAPFWNLSSSTFRLTVAGMFTVLLSVFLAWRAMLG